MKGIVAFTEQRCWADRQGVLRGRKTLTALSTLPSIASCTVASRASDPEDGHEAILEGADHHAVIPWFDGRRPLSSGMQVMATIWRLVGAHSAVAVYAPGVVGGIAGMITILRRRTLIVVAVGDPQQALAPEMFPGTRGTAVRFMITAAMRLVCRRAQVTRYVTTRVLQETYPPGRRTRAFAATDVGALTIGTPRRAPSGAHITVLTVASLDQPYKGIHELISSVEIVRRAGLDLRLRVAGTGRLADELAAIGSSAIGDEACQFVGHLDREALNREFEEADLFVLPSWTEGMPRALVEAMAAGLPAIGTAVGGVTELLEPRHLTPPRRPDLLAEAMHDLIGDRSRWEETSRRNLRTAQQLLQDAARQERQFVDAVASEVGQS